MSDLEQRLDAAIEADGELVRVGSLEFPTGRIVAADPYRSEDARAFERQVAPGRYELVLGRVRTELFGRRVAFARLRFADAEPVRHEPALTGPDDEAGFSVGTGLAAYMDEQARDDFVAAMGRYSEQHPDGSYHGDRLARDLKATSASGDPDDPGWWTFHQPEGSTLDVAVFRSGLGDGRYEPYWGLTDSGDPATLFIDFGVV